MPPAGTTGPSPDVRALISYTGPAMPDPTLAKRLGDIDIPVHVLWGESDGIADPEYGQGFRRRDPRLDLHPAPPHRPPAAARDP